MRKIQIKSLQTRIWICYIFLDFYATELKLSEIEEQTVAFAMNRKKLFWVSKFWAAVLNVSLSVRNFTEIQGLFPEKLMLFLQKPYIIVNLHLSTYQIWKNIMGHIK